MAPLLSMEHENLQWDENIPAKASQLGDPSDFQNQQSERTLALPFSITSPLPASSLLNFSNTVPDIPSASQEVFKDKTPLQSKLDTQLNKHPPQSQHSLDGLDFRGFSQGSSLFRSGVEMQPQSHENHQNIPKGPSQDVEHPSSAIYQEFSQLSTVCEEYQSTPSNPSNFMSGTQGENIHDHFIGLSPMVTKGAQHHLWMDYDQWNTSDTSNSAEDLETLRAGITQLQTHIHKLQAIPHPAHYATFSSSLNITEAKHDTIISMLYRHAAFTFPPNCKLQLPNCQLFNVMLKSYFLYFHDQHEVLHLPGLLDQSKGEDVINRKKDILIFAMCCAGAFAHPNRELRQYATGLQELLWRTLNCEFESSGHNVPDLESLQASHLSIFVRRWGGKFCRTEISQPVGGGLDAMVRCATDLAGAHESWMEEETQFVLSGEEQNRWREFVQREERKRLVYAHQEFETLFAVSTGVRPRTTVAELAMPLLCEQELWDAKTAREWAALFNSKLRSRLPGLHSLSPTSLLQEFSRHSSDIATAEDFGLRRPHEHFNIFLMGILRYVTSFADNRLSRNIEDSCALQFEFFECNQMLEYWWHAFKSASIPPKQDAGKSLDRLRSNMCILFHFIAMMLHVPLRDVSMANMENHLPRRNAAINRLWYIWKARGGQQARLGLWHAGQIIRISRIVVDNETAPFWLAPLVTQVAGVFWIYAALIHYEVSRGSIFNWDHFQLDSEGEWDTLPMSARDYGIPSITTHKGEIVALHNRRSVVTECAILLKWGSLKRKEKESSGKTILDELFIMRLDGLAKFGDCELLVDPVSGGAANA